MTITIKPIAPINTRKAILLRDWNRLQDDDPDLADGIQADVERGCTPDQVYRDVLTNFGPHRANLAWWCRNAAEYLHQQNGGGE